MHSAVGSLTYSAPEVITSHSSKGYSSACDLWSLGVLAYVMLCGLPPFRGTEHQHLEAAMQEKYSFDGKIWNSTSEDAKDFVRGLLRASPDQRVSIESLVK